MFGKERGTTGEPAAGRQVALAQSHDLRQRAELGSRAGTVEAGVREQNRDESCVCGSSSFIGT